MSHRLTHYRILVDDFAAAHRFYRDVMGLEPVFPADGGPYAEFRTGAGSILAIFQRSLMDAAIGQPHRPRTDSIDRIVLCFNVDDVDKAASELERRGVRLVSPPADQPDWMIRVAHFRDPEGNLIEINAPLPRQ